MRRVGLRRGRGGGGRGVLDGVKEILDAERGRFVRDIRALVYLEWWIA